MAPLQLLGVTSALEYLHGKTLPIYHGDVHPVRIFYDTQNSRAAHLIKIHDKIGQHPH
jgi:hypothetical protein